MRRQGWVIVLLLLIALLMVACDAAQPEEALAPTEAMTSTEAPTKEPTEAPTEAPTEPPEPVEFMLTETVFPEENAATGTLKFYIKDQEIYAGGPVSSLLDAGVATYDDMEQILQPWHISGVLRVRVQLEDVSEKNEPYVFFMAINASDEPKMISECLFYSIAINTDKNVQFGSGREDTPFVTGKTKRDEIVEAYGEPDYNFSRDSAYREIAYYEPFSCAYFSFLNGKVRQVYTYYSANVLGHLADTLDYEFSKRYFGNDCYILMNRYMDVMPYLHAEDGTEKLPKDTGVLEKLTESITLAGEELALGIRCKEMPKLFGEPLWGQLLYLHDMRYVLVGRNNPEQFYLLNLDGKDDEKMDNRVVKGVFTQNRNYQNWGRDNSAFHEFRYENLTQDSTIEDVLEQYGMPMELHCTSSSKAFFAWLFYKDKAGNTLRICVDPMLNQLIELRVSKYYEGEIQYP